MADSPTVRKDPEILVPEADLPQPEAVNWFQFSRAADAVQLLVGYVDLNAIHRAARAAKAGQQPDDLPVDVFHRFMMSMTGFNILKNQMDDLLRQIAEIEATKESK